MNTPLKAWRIAADRKPADVAADAGVTVAMWNRWENGTRQVPATRVVDIEALTGVSRHALRPDVFGDAPAVSA